MRKHIGGVNELKKIVLGRCFADAIEKSFGPFTREGSKDNTAQALPY